MWPRPRLRRTNVIWLSLTLKMKSAQLILRGKGIQWKSASTWGFGENRENRRIFTAAAGDIFPFIARKIREFFALLARKKTGFFRVWNADRRSFSRLDANYASGRPRRRWRRFWRFRRFRWRRWRRWRRCFRVGVLAAWAAILAVWYCTRPAAKDVDEVKNAMTSENTSILILRLLL